MATFNSYSPGQFCWIDLMSKDMSSAAAFYAKVFGWEAERQLTQNGPPYANFTLQGQTVCGLGEMNEPLQASGMPPVWNSYISVAGGPSGGRVPQARDVCHSGFQDHCVCED